MVKLYHSFCLQEIMNKFALLGKSIVMNKAPDSQIGCMFAFLVF